MDSQLNINHNNFDEMIQEGVVSVDLDETNALQIHVTKKIANLKYVPIITPKFKVEDCSSLFNKDISISYSSTKPMFTMHFQMGGAGAYGFRKKQIYFEGGQNNFGVFNLEQMDYLKIIGKVPSTSLEIHISQTALEDLANHYPKIIGIAYSNYLKGNTFLNNDQYRKTSSEMIHIISQIKHANLLGNAREIYVEAKVLELLALQIQQDSTLLLDTNKNQCKSIDDIEKIHEAKRLLLLDLNQTLTIPQLSKHVGINECKLKYGFKKVYNQTVYECLFDHKMNLARKLLLDTNKTVAEIAFVCGYGNPSNFIAGFRKKYGVSPKEFRNRA